MFERMRIPFTITVSAILSSTVTYKFRILLNDLQKCAKDLDVSDHLSIDPFRKFVEVSSMKEVHYVF